MSVVMLELVRNGGALRENFASNQEAGGSSPSGRISNSTTYVDIGGGGGRLRLPGATLGLLARAVLALVLLTGAAPAWAAAPCVSPIERIEVERASKGMARLHVPVLECGRSTLIWTVGQGLPEDPGFVPVAFNHAYADERWITFRFGAPGVYFVRVRSCLGTPPDRVCSFSETTYLLNTSLP